MLPYYHGNNKLKEINVSNIMGRMKNNKLKEIGIKNFMYYFSDDKFNIKNLDPNKIKINEKSCKNILIITLVIPNIE